MGEGGRIGQVVDGDDVKLIVVQRDSQYVPADPTEAVDSNFLQTFETSRVM